MTTDSTAPEWTIASGLLPYETALSAMQSRVAGIRAGTAREQIWLLEHPALYTSGTSANAADLSDPDRFPTFAAGRGGQWTYHGPGQLVAYVMLDLTRPHGQVPPRDTHAFVAALEAWIIASLAICQITAGTRAGRVGVWVEEPETGGDAKIAAIGVRITRWVSWHGISINLCPNLDHFSGIVPCGIREHGVTSLHALGSHRSMDDLRSIIRQTWPDIFGI